MAFFAKVSYAQTESFPQPSAGEINEAVEKLPHVRILPSNPFHFFIRVKENISRFLNSSSVQRAEYDLVLSGKRLKEAYLLMEKNDIKNASISLRRYEQRLQRLTEQMEKAKSQNQDVVELSENIADNLQRHERLLFAISQQTAAYKNSYDFEDNLRRATDGFKETILSIDKIKPGLKNRFPNVL